MSTTTEQLSRSNRSRAGTLTKRAAKEAQQAADWYRQADATARSAAWLTQRPDLWSPEYSYTPAQLEASARSWAAIGDTYLQSSFSSTCYAAFYRELAAKYITR